MQPVKKGRSCHTCSKTVIDFTSMPDEAIVQYLRRNARTAKVCGRFRNGQLNRPLLQTDSAQLQGLKKIAAALISFVIVKNSSAQLPVYDTSVYTWIRSAATDSVILEQQRQFRETAAKIEGSVTDEQGQPLAGAVVALGSTATVTSTSGSFSLQAPGPLRAYSVLAVSAPGKKTAVRTLHWTSLPATVSIRMEPTQPCGCPVTTGIISSNCCELNISMAVDKMFVPQQPAKRKRSRKKG